MITRMAHASFTVSDMDRSIAFYCDLLGLKVGFDTAQLGIKMGGPVCDAITGCPGTESRNVFLTIDRGVLELVEYTPKGKPLVGNKPSDIGSAHVCFKTDDIRGFYRTLLAQSVSVVSEPQNLEGDTWIMYFQDPDGIYLEAIQGQSPVEA
jgi:catechol 2,3-dioxygenase-like lactoylglutathione lyase family enzyme